MYEEKVDGYRMVVYKDDDGVRLISRNGRDHTRRFPELVKALPWSLLWPSLALTAVGLAGFAVGLRVQDRLDQRGFNRAVLAFLALLGAWLLIRSLW